MLINKIKKLGYGGAHPPIPENISDTFIGTGGPFIDSESKNTNESTLEKDKYMDIPGSRISFKTLIDIYPELKNKLKELWRKYKRINWDTNKF